MLPPNFKVVQEENLTEKVNKVVEALSVSTNLADSMGQKLIAFLAQQGSLPKRHDNGRMDSTDCR